MTLLLCGRRGPWCRANPLRCPGKKTSKLVFCVFFWTQSFGEIPMIYSLGDEHPMGCLEGKAPPHSFRITQHPADLNSRGPDGRTDCGTCLSLFSVKSLSNHCHIILPTSPSCFKTCFKLISRRFSTSQCLAVPRRLHQLLLALGTTREPADLAPAKSDSPGAAGWLSNRRWLEDHPTNRFWKKVVNDPSFC